MKNIQKFKEFNSYGKEEIKAAHKVVETGILSGFIANKSEEFYGGKYVLKLENAFRKYFKVKHAISVNSWTSGLVCAVGALKINPGDEIIVSPWTMSASATAIIAWGGIPIFSQIDEKTYCLDPNFIEEKITKKTKAILVVDIFGQSADYSKINKIAKKYNLKVISDTAQSIGSKYKNKYSGTLCDIGGFSLNRHKHIHCGEGGIVITNNSKLAQNIYMIRNHGEVINKNKSFTNLIGFNFRLGEVEAAISIEQLKKLKRIIKKKQNSARLLSKLIKNLKGLHTPKLGAGNTHVYYSYPLQIDENQTKYSKQKIFKELLKIGAPVNDGYVNLLDYNIYKNNNFKNFPFSYVKNKTIYSKKNPVYKQIINLNKKIHLDIPFCKYDFDKKDIEFISKSFHQVWKKLGI